MSDYDKMRQSDLYDDDAPYEDEYEISSNVTEKEKYFEFYDDIKTSIKEDW